MYLRYPSTMTSVDMKLSFADGTQNGLHCCPLHLRSHYVNYLIIHTPEEGFFVPLLITPYTALYLHWVLPLLALVKVMLWFAFRLIM